MQPTEPRHWVFISYSHANRREALALRRRLQRFNLPARLAHLARTPPETSTQGRVFLDTHDLVKDGTDLPDLLRLELARAQKVIVLCSPEAADPSCNVNLELEAMARAGRMGDVIPILIAGTPGDPTSDAYCFPPMLRGLDGAGEVNPASPDFRKDPDLKDTREWSNLLAALLGIDRDFLFDDRRRTRRMQWFLRGLSVMTLCAAVLTIGVLWSLWREAEDDNIILEKERSDLQIEMNVVSVTLVEESSKAAALRKEYEALQTQLAALRRQQSRQALELAESNVEILALVNALAAAELALKEAEEQLPEPCACALTDKPQ